MIVSSRTGFPLEKCLILILNRPSGKDRVSAVVNRFLLYMCKRVHVHQLFKCLYCVHLYVNVIHS